MRRFIVILAAAGLLSAACSDDIQSDGYDLGPDLAVDQDKGAPRPDGPAAKPDGPAAKPDGPAAKPDGPAVKPDGPAVKPDSGPASCKAMDVKGVGSCEKLLGQYWDGTGCQTLTGCTCSGADCGKLYSTTAACSAAHAHCGKAKCSAWDAKGQGPCTLMLGYIWDGKKCQGIGGCSCLGADCKDIYSSLAKCQAGQAHCP